jgi:2-alkyl-3-oxoalkanoate reductase
VTGATSMIGGAVVDRLEARGDTATVLQRRSAGRSREVLGDITDPDEVARAVAGNEAVVHLAAKVGVTGTWDEYQRVNVVGTETVVSVARAAGVSRFVHVSSPSVAHGGHAIVGAGAEPAVTGRRRAWYAESKALAERWALTANGTDMGVVAVRPHLVWGPGDTQLVGRIVERAAAGRLALVGGGTALVDTTFVDNAISAHLAALDAVSPGAVCAGRPYVIANGEPRPIRDLVAGICAAAGVPFAPRDVPARVARSAGSVIERLWPLVRDGEPPLTRFVAEQLGTAHWFDPRPAAADLDWHPTVSVDEGLARLATSFA